MKQGYYMISQKGEAEIVEKKSRFIGNALPIDSEEEAYLLIKEIKKLYRDARHNCFAFILGEKGELKRCSDDGEPSGTAGKPILDILSGSEVQNALVIVTRYFGGTLLGTGGLVRAYSQAAKEALENSTIVFKENGFYLTMQTDYTHLGKVQYLLNEKEIQIVSSSYEDKVNLQVAVGIMELEKVKEELRDLTNGQIVFLKEEECAF